MRILSVVLLALTGCASFSPIDNFYEVDGGKYYRSRQLSKSQFKKKFEELGIKTVVNLRGADPEKSWYRDEVAVTLQNGVELVDIGMSARRLPHRANLLRLLDTFKYAERPLLVHCMGGADRTGLATAIYRLVHMGTSKEEALKDLSVKYGHLEFRHPNKRYFVRELWQGEGWARSIYDPCAPDQDYGDFYDQSKYCVPRIPEEGNE